MQGEKPLYPDGLGRKLSARQISAATSILFEQGMNIDAIKRLTGRIPLDECQGRCTHQGLHQFSVSTPESSHCHAEAG